MGRRAGRVPLASITASLVALLLALLCLPSGGASDRRPSFAERVRGSILGSLVADSLALATHFEYDAGRIRRELGALDMPSAPRLVRSDGSLLHKGKEAGHTTDNGDNTLILLDFVADNDAFSLTRYVNHWISALEQFEGHRSYTALFSIKRHKLGVANEDAVLDSEDIASAVNFSPFIAVATDEDTLVRLARKVVLVTSKNRDVLDTAEFLARTLHRIVHSAATPVRAIVAAARATNSDFVSECVRRAFAAAKEVDARPPSERDEYADDAAIVAMGDSLEQVEVGPTMKLGKSSVVGGALPAIVYLIARHGKDFRRAAIENALIGGDSGARGSAIGMILGAYHGVQGVPAEWVQSLAMLGHAELQISRLLQRSNVDVNDHDEL